MGRFTRQEILERLTDQKAKKIPIIVGGAGMGIVAKMEDKAGIDIIVAYNSGTFRVNGHPSCMGLMAYGDANLLTERLGKQLLPVVERTPVIAGIGAADPYRQVENVIEAFSQQGFSGFTNFPTNGSYEGWFRERVDTAGVGYPAEVDMIRTCRDKNYFTVAYAYTESEIKSMIDAGADAIAIHVGATSGGSVGWNGALSLEEACKKVEQLYNMAVQVADDRFYFIHGGPFENPDTVQFCFDRVPVDGFVGASSMERLPIEQTIKQTIKAYKSICMR